VLVEDKYLTGWLEEEPFDEANSWAVTTVLVESFSKYPRWKKDEGNEMYSPSLMST
jgi:hypothetical protein